jgi:hypothetical protein
MEIQNKKRDDTAELTANAIDCTPAYVRMIVRGDRKTLSEKAKRILDKYNSILQAKEKLSTPAEQATI